MKVKKLACLAAVAGATMIAGTAQADFVGIEAVQITSPITGTSVPSDFGLTTYRIYAAFTAAGTNAGGDVNQVVAVAGTASHNLIIPASYEDALSSAAFAPPGAAFIGVAPSVEWDGFLSVGSNPDGTGIAPGFLTPPLGDTITNLLSPIVSANAGYGTAGPVAAGLAKAAPTSTGFGVLIAQISNPSGSDVFQALIQDGTGAQFNGVAVVPAPGAIALLGLAGLVGRPRRRRA